MTANLLCPGPSLNEYRGDSADIVIGVNRAATFHRCDVWAVMDWPLVSREYKNVLGNPILLTIQSSIDSLHNRGIWQGKYETLDDLKPQTHPHAWTLFTAPAAACYAVIKGCTSIRVYGADMHGMLDCDGIAAGENRSDERWVKERHIWRGVIEWAKKLGAEFYGIA